MINTQLIEARLKRHLTTEEASKRIGVSDKTYRRWEYGTHQPHISTLDLLCKAFNEIPENLGFAHLIKTSQISKEASGSEDRDLHLKKCDDLFSIGMQALIISQQANGWSLEELHCMIDQTIPQHKTPNHMSRKDALKIIAAIPLAFFNVPTFAKELTPNDTFPLFASGISASWKIYYNGGNLSEVQETTNTYLHLLEPLMLSHKPKGVVTDLLSQTYQLASMISLENEDYGNAALQADRSVDYSEGVSDPNIRAAAIMRQITVLYYQKRYKKMSTALQAVVPLIKDVSPLMQARIYSELGIDNVASSPQDAIKYSQMAVEICPTDVEIDPTYAYTFTSPYILYLNQEIAYTYLEQHKNAWTSLQQAEKYVPETMFTRRIELVTHQAKTALALGELELSCDKLINAISISKVWGSNLWLTDIESIHQQLQSKWKNNKRVQNIGEMLNK
jgi:transcriptional regulator with XRE-family HTH domain/tetratricopeptide (TPR) repeat protein